MRQRQQKLVAAGCTAVLLFSMTGCTGDTLLHGRTQGLSVQGSVMMDESNVNALTEGQVQSVAVQEGDTVRKGQTLVVMNSDSLAAQRDAAQADVAKAQAAVLQQQAALAQAQAAVAQAQATLESVKKGANAEQRRQLRLAVSAAQATLATAQSAFQTAQKTLSRTKALYAAGGVSKSDLDTAQNAYITAQEARTSAQANLGITQSRLQDALNGASAEDLAKAQAAVAQVQANVSAASSAVVQAQATVRAAQANVDGLQTAIRKCTLTSPSAGVVTTVNVKNGDVVSSGLPTVVVTHTADPYILCDLPETDLSRVKNGQKVSVKLSATGGTAYTGRIVRINKEADFATKKASNDSDFDILTYGVKVVLDTKQKSSWNSILRAGMTAFVIFGT